MTDLWGGRFREPVFVLTGDQDWAPDWALQAMLDETIGAGVPLHLFVTNRSPVLDTANDPALTRGIHPNFLPGSSHGGTPEAVIAHCLELVDRPTTVRCHSFFENTPVLGKLFANGLRADSNLGLFGQGGLVPLIHCTGLLRFPVFFEDDVFFNLADGALSLEPLRSALFSPGLKILNFHPSLVGLNAPSQGHYDAARSELFGPASGPHLEFGGRGTRTILRELVAMIRAGGASFVSFESLAREVLAGLERTRGMTLYEWGRRSWAS